MHITISAEAEGNATTSATILLSLSAQNISLATKNVGKNHLQEKENI